MELLPRLGAQVRSLRTRNGWTQAELARRTGLSPRFLVDLEKGDGNISVARLAEIAAALDVSLATLLGGFGPVHDEADRLACLDPVRRRHALRAAGATGKVALVGLRGAGKSTVGTRLAERLAARFVEVDAEVEARAGMRLGEIFEYHGAGRYRELEREALARLLDATDDLVLATGGSVVTAADTWADLRRSSRTVWLRASPASHLARVEAQGDVRPMQGRPDALAELQGILAARDTLYAQAEVTVDTEGREVDDVVADVAARLAG
jgi:XRE family aerobic/anaerobic benzoate catabolism transcriptional regulator